MMTRPDARDDAKGSEPRNGAPRNAGPQPGAPPAPEPAAVLRRRADRICALIVASDYPDVDIDIEISKLRRWCDEHLPEHRDLFEMVYASRFHRLREQFRR